LTCERFIVKGDVKFGRDVVVQGAVTVNNTSGQPALIPDGAVLTGEIVIK